jgi:hypothetical protein
MITTTKGKFHELLEKMKGLSMAQFNYIKANNITDFEVIGDLADFDNDFVSYRNAKGEEILVNTIGEVYNTEIIKQ